MSHNYKSSQEPAYFYQLALPESVGYPTAFVATNRQASQHTTPAQLVRTTINSYKRPKLTSDASLQVTDPSTSAVYLVNTQGMLFAADAKSFPADILNAPRWKTIPLPKEQYRLSLGLPTPPTTPPTHYSDISSSSLSYTGVESEQWQQQRVRRDSAQVYPQPSTSSSSRRQQPQTQYRYAVSQSYPPSAGMYYPQPQQQQPQQQQVIVPTQKKKVRFE